ncbi:MAG: hypothetical protein GF355_05280 [Candidatus Eisenbacteria bacterium]|nr:hypothetical protein [Candidatus Eisenbacteria bacterium]
MRAYVFLSLLVILAVPAVQGDTSDIPRSRLHLPPPGIGDLRPPAPGERTPPAGDETVNPAEFCRADAMIIYWTSWHSQELIDMCLAVAADDRVLCCVSSPSQQNQAYTMMSDAGVNMANIEFFETVSGSVWIRDYGPFCIYDDGHLAITDMRYGGGTADQIPVYIAQHEGLPWYESLLLHHGGNHITDGNGMGFFSTNLTNYNPWSIEQIRAELQDYLGLDSLVIFPTMQGDQTGHCDMFVKLLNDTLFVVGEYEDPGDAIGNDYYYLNQLAADLDAMQNLDGRDFEVVRLPMNPIVSGTYHVNRTYTNSLILNDKVLVPTYNTELDGPALQIYAECMPGYEIIGIDSKDLIEYLGAVHCVSNTLHHENPLMILHEPLLAALMGDAPVLRCRLNPRFSDREVEAHYESPAAGQREIVPAVFAGGVWYAQLPPMFDDFNYWFVARAYTDAGVMETTLPAGAPEDFFTCHVQDPASVSASPRLTQPLAAWPNPCRPEATLGFALSHEAPVELAIYNVRGRLQRRLLGGATLPAGGHNVAWNGHDDAGEPLPNGVYWVRLALGSECSRERLVLIR